MKTIEALLHDHPFFAGMNDEYIRLIAGCAVNHVFNPQEYIARENDPADYFYLIRNGRVSIEISQPNYGAVILQTLQDGDICGWSWLFPPHRWTFDAKTQTQVQTLKLDGRCLRTKCANDTNLGFDLMQRFARIMTERLQATRLQLLDVYGYSQNKKNHETQNKKDQNP
ncbi:cyclic nucleotide-binding domain-containing protein [Neptunomonas antarctica]|uniref:Cyclic nucleotide-binding domain-containing protein n=1 Tax=Neptunomonas antarctica TaxID=619304 RepID=A0A1N7L3T1_9GAMM|nr:cyclic nucleotide-binding domain-containing protein [Neptunomonas antarctica]SIS68535.1 Cyclic nucleotide-binding domain-containing protein [Neptunomonas antarctica]